MSDRSWIFILFGFCLAGLGGALTPLSVQIGIILIYGGSALVYCGLSALRRMWREGTEPTVDAHPHAPR
jgi:hypothetical protein